MNGEQRLISVINPISPSFTKVRDMLFAPFIFEKWLAIGFCAWLAHLGERSYSFNYQIPSDSGTWQETISKGRDFIENNLSMVITVGTIVLMAVIAIVIVCFWLRSRGQFMFLHSVVNNEDRIQEGWNRFAKEGNKLFVFYLIAYLILLAIAAGFATVIILCAFSISRGDGGIIAGIIGLIPTVLALLCFMIVVGFFLKFTVDFVVPIMYLRRCGPVKGWRIFWSLVSSNKVNFLLYILFQIVIFIAIAIITLFGTFLLCIACCCLVALISLPFVWAVVFLPILVFTRSYSLYYLRQFGPEWDVFLPKTVVPLETV